MIIKKHLCEYTRKDGVPYYVIYYKRINVANRKSFSDILKIYDECVECGWDVEKLKEIKLKYKIGGYRKSMKYIYKNQKGMYFIQRKSKYYAGSWDKEEIMKYRDLLVENDWNPDVLESVGYRKRKSYGLPKYIRLTSNGKFGIYYKHKGYGVFSSLEVAVEERDLLMANGWDYDFVDLC